MKEPPKKPLYSFCEMILAKDGQKLSAEIREIYSEMVKNKAEDFSGLTEKQFLSLEKAIQENSVGCESVERLYFDQFHARADEINTSNLEKALRLAGLFSEPPEKASESPTSSPSSNKGLSKNR